MTKRWILDQEDLIADTDTESFRSYRHAECEDLELRVYFCDDEEETDPRVTYYVGFSDPGMECGMDCERRVDVPDPEFHDPNTSAFVIENIDPIAEKVRAYLERFPEDLDRISAACLICGVDQTPVTALWHYEHFRDHHLGNSTVKSASKQ